MGGDAQVLTPEERHDVFVKARKAARKAHRNRKGTNAHRTRHGNVPGCDMCDHRVRPYPVGHHSPKRAVHKGKSNTKLVAVGPKTPAGMKSK